MEYSAYAYRTRLAALGSAQSMKRPRAIGDNTYIESFFHSMKADAIHGRLFRDDCASPLQVIAGVLRKVGVAFFP